MEALWTVLRTMRKGRVEAEAEQQVVYAEVRETVLNRRRVTSARRQTAINNTIEPISRTRAMRGNIAAPT